MSPGRRCQVRIYERCGHTPSMVGGPISRVRLFPQIPMEDKPLPAAATRLLVTKCYHYRRRSWGLIIHYPMRADLNGVRNFTKSKTAGKDRFAESIPISIRRELQMSIRMPRPVASQYEPSILLH
jgi:hypothetical protein